MDNALYQELDRREARLQASQDAGTLARDALRAIIWARDLAPDVLIPTPLMTSIEAARKVIG